jgi:WXXGXW repeat (2 copies)
MLKSSRHLARAACAAVLLVGIGAGAAAAQPVIVEKAMPAPIVEVVPAAPGAGYNWVPGHWAWRGGAWFWVKGHHVRGVVVDQRSSCLRGRALGLASRHLVPGLTSPPLRASHCLGEGRPDAIIWSGPLSKTQGSPGLNGGSSPGGTFSSAMARSIATVM